MKATDKEVKAMEAAPEFISNTSTDPIRDTRTLIEQAMATAEAAKRRREWADQQIFRGDELLWQIEDQQVEGATCLPSRLAAALVVYSVGDRRRVEGNSAPAMTPREGHAQVFERQSILFSIKRRIALRGHEDSAKSERTLSVTSEPQGDKPEAPSLSQATAVLRHGRIYRINNRHRLVLGALEWTDAPLSATALAHLVGLTPRQVDVSLWRLASSRLVGRSHARPYTWLRLVESNNEQVAG